jgi:hypothetical protein
MKKLINKPVPLSEEWNEVNKKAIEIADTVCSRINSITPVNTPQIKNEIGNCGYWRQGLLELTIAELEKRV